MPKIGFGEGGFGANGFGGVVAYAPVITLENVPGGVLVTVVNPEHDDGAEVLRNRIERRAAGGAWTFARYAVSGASWIDYDATAGGVLQYRATPRSIDDYPQNITGSASITFELGGFGIHEDGDPAGTFRGFPYHVALTSESREVEVVTRGFLGRRLPVVDFGGSESVDLARGAMIPWGPDHDDAVQWWRDRHAGRRLLRYRDSRGRDLLGVLGGGLGIADRRDGTSVTFTFLEVDRIEAA